MAVKVNFPCGDITLEGEWHVPGGSGPFPAVVVCHPHPQHGGNMQNNVVEAIAQALPSRSVAVLRFNFRGVDGSEGSYGEGIAEQDDVKAALDFVLSSPNIDSRKIGLAGYSFGARVALSVALHDERVSRLALVSPPLSGANWEEIKKYTRPKLLVTGSADAFISVERFRQSIQDVPDRGSYQIVLGADHFWWGYEAEMARKVEQFFVAGFTPV